MDANAFRITTVATTELCAQLDCAATTDDLDDALADSGYVRLDHGLTPGPSTAIMTSPTRAGRDPGHRGPVIALVMSLNYVVHADGRPEGERLRRVAENALETIATDPVGERIVAALAAYGVSRDLGMKAVVTEGPYAPAAAVLARLAYDAARNRHAVTDVGIARAVEIGGDIPEWRAMVMSNMRPEEPVMMVRRHAADDYERLDIAPPLAEIIAWIRANPETNVTDFERYAQMVGLDPKAAGRQIADALQERLRLTTAD